MLDQYVFNIWLGGVIGIAISIWTGTGGGGMTVWALVGMGIGAFAAWSKQR